MGHKGVSETKKNSRRLDKQSMVVIAVLVCLSLVVVGVMFGSVYKSLADEYIGEKSSYEVAVTDFGFVGGM